MAAISPKQFFPARVVFTATDDEGGVVLHVRSHPGVARNNPSSHAKDDAVRLGTGAATLSEVMGALWGRAIKAILTNVVTLVMGASLS